MIGPGKGAVGVPTEPFDRAKMELKVWVVKEPRRARPVVSDVLLFSLLDMLAVKVVGTLVILSCGSRGVIGADVEVNVPLLREFFE